MILSSSEPLIEEYLVSPKNYVLKTAILTVVVSMRVSKQNNYFSVLHSIEKAFQNLSSFLQVMEHA